MNASDILKYGHQTVLQALSGLPENDWETTGVCGVWSVKHIVAHLSSFELVLAEILTASLDGAPTPTLDQFRIPGGQFNEAQVAMRKDRSVADVLAELNEVHAGRTMPLMILLSMQTTDINASTVPK